MPVESFVECSAAQRPENTLFPDVSSYNVTYTDLETYLPLVLGIFEVSPQGALV